MAVPLKEVMKKFTPSQRTRVEARAKELIKAEQRLTQKRMALPRSWGIGKRLISFLRKAGAMS